MAGTRKKKKKEKTKPKNTLFPPSPARPHLYKCRKTKRSHESVTAFQRALVLIVSLKQLFSSHSVPTSHSQLLAACTHMYIRPHGHFICRGNVLSVWLLWLNASFSLSLPSPRPPPLLTGIRHISDVTRMRFRRRLTITPRKIRLHPAAPALRRFIPPNWIALMPSLSDIDVYSQLFVPRLNARATDRWCREKKQRVKSHP